MTPGQGVAKLRRRSVISKRDTKCPSLSSAAVFPHLVSFTPLPASCFSLPRRCVLPSRRRVSLTRRSCSPHHPGSYSPRPRVVFFPQTQGRLPLTQRRIGTCLPTRRPSNILHFALLCVEVVDGRSWTTVNGSCNFSSKVVPFSTTV